MPFTRDSSELFDRPSISLGRIIGGDAVNRVPDLCAIDLDIRYLPGQNPDEILAAVNALGGTEVVHVFHREPIIVARDEPHVQVLAEAVSKTTPVQDSIAVGRDGTSDVISFLNAGIPGVEFGPVGDGHHGPDEWVSIESLSQYRRALVEFVSRRCPRCRRQAGTEGRVSPAFEDLPRPGIWKKLILGCVLVVFATAGATSVAAFHEVDNVVDTLKTEQGHQAWARATWPRSTPASRRRSCCWARTAGPTTPRTAAPAPARARTPSSWPAWTPTARRPR